MSRLSSYAPCAAIALFVLCGIASPARACESNAECKGGRICVNGSCTAPIRDATSSQSCAKEKDCPADLTCLDQKCVPPRQSLAQPASAIEPVRSAPRPSTTTPSAGFTRPAGGMNPGGDDTGIELAARMGYGIPLGNVTGEANSPGVGDVASGFIPLNLEVGYRFNKNLAVGAYFQYALAFTGSNCGDGCSASGTRYGLQAHWHFGRDSFSSFDPWLGIGIGRENLNVSLDSTATGTSSGGAGSASGWEFLSLQGGALWPIASNFSLGPFASLSFAQYGSITGSSGGTSVSKDVQNSSLHELFFLGVRAAFTP